MVKERFYFTLLQEGGKVFPIVNLRNLTPSSETNET